jgi:hypothetical protein
LLGFFGADLRCARVVGVLRARRLPVRGSSVASVCGILTFFRACFTILFFDRAMSLSLRSRVNRIVLPVLAESNIASTT